MERWGFGVFALEFGVRDGHALARWLHSEGADGDLDGIGGTLARASLGEPPSGSVERALLDAGHGGVISLTDLREAPFIASIRTQSADLATPVAEAFGAVIATATATLDPTVTIPTASG